MGTARIVIISGAPGSGKSSVSRKLAENSAYERAVHIHTDDFYGYICKGYIPPWLPDADEQNGVIIESFIACAVRLAMGGYEVIVDGVIGPWFLDPWFRIVQEGFDVRYIVLRPDMHTTVRRATERCEADALTDVGVVEHMWRCFAEIGAYEPHIVDTAGQSVEESVLMIRKLLDGGGMRLIQR